MIVEFGCPECGKTCRAEDRYAGRKAQCRYCQAVVTVPDMPPVKVSDPVREPAPMLSEADDDDTSGTEELLPRRPREEAADSSYGLASLYLATLSFLLFFTPALLAGMTGAIGASVAYFAGIFVSSGCFLFCWHGLRLAERAARSPAGRGYAEAGKIVNRFFLTFYALGALFFLIGGLVTLFLAKRQIGGLQDQLKGLQQLQGLDKLLVP